ncbi:hypothetical protein F4808DRAFT_463955 [Astrocystis sublimbata]|nr:hypothetical protein F4808DRAFT_463955 [Astrocystis sublimbata]
MANSDDLDVPIALRRKTRQCAARSRVVSAPITTPGTPAKSKKRVRFSDPGPELSRYRKTGSTGSTGLTPIIKRSTLSAGEPFPKRRRPGSAVGNAERRPASNGDPESADELDVLSSSGVIAAAPVKAVKPRTRGGKNSTTTAKVEAEVQRLRAELASRDAEIERLHNETLVQDTDRILELEEQIKALRAELAQPQLPTLNDGDASDCDLDNDNDLPQSFYDWTLAARDPYSDSYLDGSDDFQDTTMTDVVCSTPSKRRRSAGPPISKSASASFPTPPCTSPTLPATPCSVRKTMIPVTPHSEVGIQASLPDPDKEALEAELASLRLEMTKLTSTLESHAALQTRLSEKLAGASSPLSAAARTSKASRPGLEEHLDTVLQRLSERTKALAELDSSLSSLGFRGTGASEIIGSITSGFREARLELEYLSPGEITLPLTSHGAQVLDLVLTSLRHLARKTKEDEESIDEYHALEQSLRSQLAARVDAMAGLRAEQQENATVLRERDAHIAELEIGLDRLKGAAEGYRRDIVELETLVQRLEDSEKSTTAKMQADLNSTYAELGERAIVIADLETKLALMLKTCDELEVKLKDLQRRRDAETKVRNKSAGAALALRDARVSELRREIYTINDSLRGAHETIVKLRVENVGLEERAEQAEEREKLAREAVETMRGELEKVTAAAGAPRRSTRSSSRLMTPEPQPGNFLSASFARSGSGKDRKRRRHDSGLGFLEEDDDDVELIA